MKKSQLRVLCLLVLLLLAGCNPFIFSDDVGSGESCDPGVAVSGSNGRLTVASPDHQTDPDC